MENVYSIFLDIDCPALVKQSIETGVSKRFKKQLLFRFVFF